MVEVRISTRPLDRVTFDVITDEMDRIMSEIANLIWEPLPGISNTSCFPGNLGQPLNYAVDGIHLNSNAAMDLFKSKYVSNLSPTDKNITFTNCVS